MCVYIYIYIIMPPKSSRSHSYRLPRFGGVGFVWREGKGAGKGRAAELKMRGHGRPWRGEYVFQQGYVFLDGDEVYWYCGDWAGNGNDGWWVRETSRRGVVWWRCVWSEWMSTVPGSGIMFRWDRSGDRLIEMR